MEEILASVQVRRDTKANWETINPILLEGEATYELDTDMFKIGDGIKHYSDLPYHNKVGPQGPQGEPGPTPQISMNVSTGNPGTNASVSVTGTAENPVINLTVPRGDTGKTGSTGPKGDTGSSGVYIGTSQPTDSSINVWIDSDGEPTEVIDDFSREAIGQLNGDFLEFGSILDITETKGKNMFNILTLWDSNLENGTAEKFRYVAVQLPNGVYTVSTNVPDNTSSNVASVIANLDGLTFSSDSAGVFIGRPRTLSVTSGVMYIGVRTESGRGYNTYSKDTFEYYIQIESGLEETEYEDFGHAGKESKRLASLQNRLDKLNVDANMHKAVCSDIPHGFLITSFHTIKVNGVVLSISYDGYNVEEIKEIYADDTGTTGNPDISKIGKYFYLTFTGLGVTSEGKRKIKILRSLDLQNWDLYTEVIPDFSAFSQGEADSLWAPEIFADNDGSYYMSFSAYRKTSDVQRGYTVYSYIIKFDDCSLKTYSNPVQLTNIPFFDDNYLYDVTYFNDNGTYYCMVHDGYIYTSQSIYGPFTVHAKLPTSRYTEGCTIKKYGDHFFCWADEVMSGGGGATDPSVIRHLMLYVTKDFNNWIIRDCGEDIRHPKILGSYGSEMAIAEKVYIDSLS